MALLLNTDDQALVDAVKTDAKLTNSDGVAIDTNGDGIADIPYCTKVVPIPNFNQIVPAGSDIDLKVQDGLRLAVAPLALRVRPVGLHGEVAGLPPASFISPIDVVSISVSGGSKLAVPRMVMAAASFSLRTDVPGTTVEYWVDVDGTSSTHMRFVLGTSHSMVYATWLLLLPALSSSIKLRAARLNGTGQLMVDWDDSATLTLIG